jgi:hypothetical protein
MASDVKLGMVVGLGVVIAVAVTYYSKAVPVPTGRADSVMPSLPAVARSGEPHAAGNPAPRP